MNKTRFAACLTLLALLVSCMMAPPASAATKIKKVYIKHDCAEIAVYGGEAAVPHIVQDRSMAIWDAVYFTTPEYKSFSYSWEKFNSSTRLWEDFKEGSVFTPGRYRFATQVRTKGTDYMLDSNVKIIDSDGVEWGRSSVDYGEDYSWAWIHTPDFNITDTRQYVTNLEAESKDMSSVTRYGNVVRVPSIVTISTGPAAYFSSTENGWEKLNESTNTWEDYEEYYFEAGQYHYKTRIDIKGSYGNKYRFSKDLKLKVNGVSWTVHPASLFDEAFSSRIWVTSPAIRIEPSAQSKTTILYLKTANLYKPYSASERRPYECGAKSISAADTSQIRNLFQEYGLDFAVITYADDFAVNVTGTPTKKGSIEGKFFLHNSSDPNTVHTVEVRLYVDGIDNEEEDCNIPAVVGQELNFSKSYEYRYHMTQMSQDDLAMLRENLKEYGLNASVTQSSDRFTLSVTGTPTRAGYPYGWLIFTHPTEEDGYFSLNVNISIEEAASEEIRAVPDLSGPVDWSWSRSAVGGFTVLDADDAALKLLRRNLASYGLQLGFTAGSSGYDLHIIGKATDDGIVKGSIPIHHADDHDLVYTLQITVILNRPVIAGDADDSGTTDMKDALLILRYLKDPGIRINLANADVNQDGHADMLDAILILEYDCGWDVELKKGAKG